MVELSVIMQLRSIENIHYAKTYYSIERILIFTIRFLILKYGN